MATETIVVTNVGLSGYVINGIVNATIYFIRGNRYSKRMMKGYSGMTLL